MTAYREALRFDRRPEIYLELGLTELEAGNLSEAQGDLRRAAEFDPRLLSQIPDVGLRERLETSIGNFTQTSASEQGPIATRTTTYGFPRTFAAADLPGSTGRSARGLRQVRLLLDEAGWLVYGPGETLPRGQYRVRFRLKLDAASPQPTRPAVKLDVTSDEGYRELATMVLRAPDLRVGQWQDFTVQFVSGGPLQAVEYRVYWYGATDVSCSEIMVDRR